MKRSEVYPGLVVGRWTVLEYPFLRNHNYVVKVQCSCENKTVGLVQPYHLGRTSNSCGCLRAEQEHGGRWKGGRVTWGKGYVAIWEPDHPNAMKIGYVQEHIKVMAEMLGRPLDTSHENVHHKNGVHDDNSPSNLELWSTHQPKGQRVEDKTVWAKEWLAVYDPSALAQR